MTIPFAVVRSLDDQGAVYGELLFWGGVTQLPSFLFRSVHMVRISKLRQTTFFKHLKIVGFLALSILGNGHAAEDPNPVASAEEKRVASLVLDQFAEISFAFTDAPGTGHFASTVLAMKRVRELGYERPFRLYIDPSVRRTVAKFLPGYFPAGPDQQKIPEWNATTYVLDLRASLTSRVDSAHPVRSLGITGGDDLKITPDVIGVDALLVVQPPGWYSSAELRVFRNGKNRSKIRYGSFDRVPFVYDVPEPTDVAAFARAELARIPSLTRKTEGMVALVNALASQKHEVLSAYGLSYYNGPLKLAVVADAVVFWMKRNQANAQRRGTIIPLLSSFSDEEAEFLRGTLETWNLQDQVELIDVTNPRLTEVLANVEPGKVVIVQVGGVTQDLWNYLMAQSTFPALVAGVNGINFFTMLGKPFLTTMMDSSEILSPDMVRLLRDMSDELSGRSGRLSYFFDSVRDPGSSVSRAFAENHRQSLVRGDKITRLVAESGVTICPSLISSRTFLGLSGRLRNEPPARWSVSWWLKPAKNARDQMISRWRAIRTVFSEGATP